MLSPFSAFSLRAVGVSPAREEGEGRACAALPLLRAARCLPALFLFGLPSPRPLHPGCGASLIAPPPRKTIDAERICARRPPAAKFTGRGGPPLSIPLAHPFVVARPPAPRAYLRSPLLSLTSQPHPQQAPARASHQPRTTHQKPLSCCGAPGALYSFVCVLFRADCLAAAAAAAVTARRAPLAGPAAVLTPLRALH